jgi:predicted DNA-binding transcriptional regulator AlpA
MPLSLTRGSARERLARSRSATRSADPRTTDPVAGTDATNSTGAAAERMLTSPEASDVLRLSESWLAKARMRGDGPPYAKMGRSIRYPESELLQWMRSHLRSSTSSNRPRLLRRRSGP